MICFNTSFLVLLIILIVVVAVYYDYQHRKEIKNISEGYQNELTNKCACKNDQTVPITSRPTTNNYESQDINVENEHFLPPRYLGSPLPSRQSLPIGYPGQILPPANLSHIPPIVPTRSIMREFDYANVHNELFQPSYRPSMSVMGNMMIPPISMHGPRDPANWVGIAVNKDGTITDKNKILRVYGREKYNNSNTYEYYVLLKTGSGKTKSRVERKDKTKNELYTNDSIVVPILNNAEYIFTKNENNILDYD